MCLAELETAFGCKLTISEYLNCGRNLSALAFSGTHGRVFLKRSGLLASKICEIRKVCGDDAYVRCVVPFEVPSDKLSTNGWTMSPFLPIKPSILTPEAMACFGRGLAQFHNQAKLRITDVRTVASPFLGQWWKDLLSNTMSYTEEIRAEVNQLVELAQAIVFAVQTNVEVFGDYIHGDCFPNFYIDANRLNLYDFDDAGLGPLEWDLACVRWGLAMRHTNWEIKYSSESNEELWGSFIGEYESISAREVMHGVVNALSVLRIIWDVKVHSDWDKKSSANIVSETYLQERCETIRNWTA